MKEFYKNYLQSNLFFWIFSIIGMVMMIAGFLLPPMGQIDNSVLVGVGEINGLIAIGAVIKAIDRGSSASIKHNGTELTVNKQEQE